MISQSPSMVARGPSAFHYFASSSLPPFVEETVASDQPNVLGFSPKIVGSWPDEETLDIQAAVKDLAEALAPGQPQKLQIPRVHHALVKHVPRLTARRVRSMFHGEVSRLWDDERAALRREHAAAINSKQRKAFASAAALLMRGLSAAGHPLSADQTSALHHMVGAAA